VAAPAEAVADVVPVLLPVAAAALAVVAAQAVAVTVPSFLAGAGLKARGVAAADALAAGLTVRVVAAALGWLAPRAG
jgi:hypothetical protein